MMAGGGAVSSGDGAGRASESGGAREVWHLALSGSQKLTDKHPMANNAAFFIRISDNPWRFETLTCGNDGSSTRPLRSGSAKQSILSLCGAMDCFAALAMTRKHLLLRPHRLGRIGLRQRMRGGEFRHRHRCLEDALHRRPGLQIDLQHHRHGDMADQADVGERRRVAMAEAAGLLVAGEMSLQRGQRLQGPVPAPRGLLRCRANSVRDRDSAASAAPAADGPRRRRSAPARAPGRGRAHPSAAAAGSDGSLRDIR